MLATWNISFLYLVLIFLACFDLFTSFLFFGDLGCKSNSSVLSVPGIHETQNQIHRQNEIMFAFDTFQ